MLTVFFYFIKDGCVDMDGNRKAEGDKWTGRCGECSCVNGNTICPTSRTDCPEPPSPSCKIKTDPNACCPSYICPEG